MIITVLIYCSVMPCSAGFYLYFQFPSVHQYNQYIQAQELDWSTINLQEKISSDLLSLGRDAYQCANQIYVVVKN